MAADRGRSLSSMIAELTIRGMDQLGTPAEVTTHPETGFPVISLGRRVTAAEVEQFLHEDD